MHKCFFCDGYFLKFPKKGMFIRSDIGLTPHEGPSYIVKGKPNFQSEDIPFD